MGVLAVKVLWMREPNSPIMIGLSNSSSQFQQRRMEDSFYWDKQAWRPTPRVVGTLWTSTSGTTGNGARFVRYTRYELRTP